MAFEIFDALFSYGCLDFATANAVKCSSKNTVHLISTDEVYIRWIAELIGEPLDNTSLESLAYRLKASHVASATADNDPISRLKAGDNDLVSLIFNHNKGFFDVEYHERLLDVCFDFSSYSSPHKTNLIVENLLTIFTYRFQIWRTNNQPKIDMIVAFEFAAKLYTKYIWWGVEHFDIIMREYKKLFMLTSKTMLNMMLSKCEEVHNDWVPKHVYDRNVRCRIRANLKSAIKLIKAWNQSLTLRTRLHKGLRGGIYIIINNGSKVYI